MRLRFFLAALALFMLLLSSCSRDPEKARMVVAIVYDQFPSWAYAKYEGVLSPEGALLRTRARGADHVVEYSYAGTHTAAGHTAIFTGTPPATSGVGANEAWSAERGIRSIVDDGEHRVFGLPDGFASPTLVRVDSVADALRDRHGDRARIVSLSFKDRGSVLTAGRDPDLALWYEKKIGAMTSSTYYGEALPEWVISWLDDHPTDDYYEDWVPRDPERWQQLLGPDDAPGEADYRGLGTTFPHNPGTTGDPARTFRATPASTDYLLELARVSVAELGLGDDDVPDLLVLSISSTDYSGHIFGPDSWEYVDNLVRVDDAVGQFLAELESQTNLAVLITSDHGGAPLPERSRQRLPDAGRVYPDTLPGRMNSAVAEVLGEGEWVGPYVPPFLHLSAAACERGKRDTAVTALVEALEALPEVYSAYDMRSDAAWRVDADSIETTVALAIPDPDLCAVFVVHDRGSVADEGFERGKGTGHGSPWPYDRQVPVVFAGPGVSNTKSTQPLAQNRVAATLCRLLGVEPPRKAMKGTDLFSVTPGAPE